MRIDKIELTNFKLFEKFDISFDSKFTLLIGNNSVGKTSVLEALAIACGVWLYDVTDSKIAKSRPSLQGRDIRLVASEEGDRIQFLESKEVKVEAHGSLLPNSESEWSQKLISGKASKSGLVNVRKQIRSIYERIEQGEKHTLPVIAYYGAGRAWLPHRERSAKPSSQVSRRWAAFYDCLNERIRIADLRRWFQDEITESGNRGGHFRPGFEVVKWAILQCIPNSDNAWYSTDRRDIVISIKGNPQPYGNLSAGLQTVTALVADIAIRMVTQNNYLVPRDEIDLTSIPKVLAETPGMILIDELDVHLHPTWQRRVVADLSRTFPRIQFVATTHSPQIAGELHNDQIRILDGKSAQIPTYSFGLDSNWLLENLMGAHPRNSEFKGKLQSIQSRLDAFEVEKAEEELILLKKEFGVNPDTLKLDSKIRRAFELFDTDANLPKQKENRSIIIDPPSDDANGKGRGA